MSDRQETVETGVCPYLKLYWDDTLRHGYPSPSNFCYKAEKAQPVLLAYQESVCLNGQEHDCLVYRSDHWQGALPEAVSGRAAHADRPLKKRGIALAAALAVLLLVAAAAWLSGMLPALLRAGVTSTPPGMELTQAAALAPPATATPLASQTLEIKIPETGLQQPSATATRSGPTETSTPGPQLRTPFGPDERFVIHSVRSGDTLDRIADLYGVSEGRIINVNFTKGQHSLWEGTTIIIDKNVVAEPLKAVFLEEDMLVEDFLQEYDVSEEFLRRYNCIEGEWICGDRWVILPRVKE